jgi:hypothetical protein
MRRVRNRISQLEKDIVGLHAMAALVKKKSELATAVEQDAMDRLRIATESLSCKQSILFVPHYSSPLFLEKNPSPHLIFFHLRKSLLSMNQKKTRESTRK